VRPSHTYDNTLLPFHGGYPILARLKKGQPVVVHGDGSSIWVLTHHRDFARGFLGLLGHPSALGQDFHITSDELLTWNQIFRIMADCVDGQFVPVYLPSNTIARYDPEWGASLLGDKTHSMIFDNSKLRRLVPNFQAEIPFSEGAQEIAHWYAHNPDWQIPNNQLEKLIDVLVSLGQPTQPHSSA